MTKTLKPGDKVEWMTSQSKTRGRVVTQQSEPTRLKKGRRVSPQAAVRRKSDKSGKKAAHMPGALKRR
jgi:hypothetical protein